MEVDPVMLDNRSFCW